MYGVGGQETECKEKKKTTGGGYSKPTAKEYSKQAKNPKKKASGKTPESKSKADDPKSVDHHILPCAHYSKCIVQTGNTRVCVRLFQKP